MKKMNIGVVGIPGAWSTERLAQAVEKRTGYRRIIDLDHVTLDLDSGRAWHNELDLSRLDALVVKKVGVDYSPALMDRLEILKFLHRRGTPVFSQPCRIMGVLNRLSCTVVLKNGGIPMPPTTITQDVDKALETVHRYGEAVFKPLFSTKARGMEVMTPGPETRQRIFAFAKTHGMMYIQKKIEFGGQDLGIAFLGGEYLTTYARCGHESSWNTTTRCGGAYQPFDPGPKVIALAQKAQALFGLDFTCVDVALTKAGPMVFEVSAFGGFRGIHTARGIDVADLYVAHVLKCIRPLCPERPCPEKGWDLHPDTAP